MLLPLQTPIGANFLKDWPAQNTINSELEDAYAGLCLTSHALGTYVPILTASTTNPGLGTGGTLKGFYYRIFDEIWSWGEFTFGTSAFAGVGTYTITLPFRAKTLLNIGGALSNCPVVIGNGQAYDVSVPGAGGRQPVLAVLKTVDTIVFGLRLGTAGASRFITDLTPYTQAVGDGIMWAVRYQREPS
jgi:hypothetical protein